ncbi:hypothetical protein BT69DRAFT_627674 [Atractiella rhizophila]|nr:hypothetical protein BT69DRAFT_627674 [Atractiella rhizophila]
MENENLPRLAQPPMDPSSYPLPSVTALRSRLAHTIDSIANLQDLILRSGADWSTVLPQMNSEIWSSILALGLKQEEFGTQNRKGLRSRLLD